MIMLKAGQHNRFRTVFILSFASLGSWMPSLNLWLEDQGMNGTAMGYLSAIPWLVMLVVQPFWGVLADRAGKMRCFHVSILSAAVLFAIFPLIAKGKVLIGIMTFLFSVFQTPVLPLLDSLTLDHVAKHNNVSYSSLRFWGAPGFGLGAMLTGMLTETYGSEVSFYLSATFLFLAWLVARGFVSPQPAVSAADLSFNGLGHTLNNRTLLGFLLIVMVVSLAQSASSFFLTVYMREIGASSSITGTAIGVQALSELPFYFIAAWLVKKIAPGKVLLIAIFGTALRFLLYYLNNSPYAVIGIESLNGVTWTLLWIASVEFVNEKVPPQWRTTGQSLLWAMYFGAGAVAGNVLIGRMYERMPMQQIFGLFSLLVFLTGVTSLFMLMRSSRTKPKSMSYEQDAIITGPV
jgi:PPP family 3-phenylpropionic acid transporter